MTRKILIDALHTEETRVAITENGNLEDFEVESVVKKEIKGNIYLAKVIRVEPSLQSAFVEYSGGRHGFLPFTEIHPNYFQIPIEDKRSLIVNEIIEQDDEEDCESVGEVETFTEDDIVINDKEAEDKKRELLRKYKIQEVIKSGQIVLIQVEKEERGNKGAAVTTYISLAGRYCVLMPNSNKRVKFGISRKIPFGSLRQELKSHLKTLPIPSGVTVVARTAGCGQDYKEIKKDYDYLTSLWNNIRKNAISSVAPSLVYEEIDLSLRAIRDMYNSDTTEIIIDGEDTFKKAINFAKYIGFTDVKKIKKHNEKTTLFITEDIETQLEAVKNPIVKLPSGGYLVINPTEALTAIDVNSGRAIKERDIEKTAFNTNIEAIVEIGRQCRLRDMGGLIVVDFIDMLEPINNQHLEQKAREVLMKDRAKIQMAKLSQFGLMEISRQRLRPSFLEVSHNVCPYCQGTGFVPTVQTASINLLRHIEETLLEKTSDRLYLVVPSDVALYTLNQKRDKLLELESKYSTSIILNGDDNILNEKLYVMERMSKDVKLNIYLKEKETVNTKYRKDNVKQRNQEYIKKSNTNRNNKNSKKKSWFSKLFG